MIKSRQLMMALVAFLLSSFFAQADPASEKLIREALSKKFPQAQISRVEPTVLTDIYEVEMPPHIFYISKDAKYILNGDLIDLPGDRNITQEKHARIRLDSINQLGEDSMIVFAPKETKYTISVFTDIDCGYCRKLHNEMAKYNALGIKVRYLAYPRSGPGTDSFKKAENVWCAKDRKQAMTDAKNGKSVDAKACDNPVTAHFMAGTKAGVTGTPAIFLENGQMLPGYFPAERLIQVLQQIKQ
ncbi:MAG: DsbC family protein [Gammaproteobacteria bacterium]